MHYIAATRLLLGPANKIERLSAFTTQLQPHLPPIDTLTAVLQTTSGVPGTVSVSFGTTFTGEKYSVACEKGTVTVTKGTVVVTRDGSEETKTFPQETNGVKEEVVVWANGLKNANIDKRQTPEEALADLYLVSVVQYDVHPVLRPSTVGVNFQERGAIRHGSEAHYVVPTLNASGSVGGCAIPSFARSIDRGSVSGVHSTGPSTSAGGSAQSGKGVS